MISGNPLAEPPHTPFPDGLASSDSEVPPAPVVPIAVPPIVDQPLVVPESSTADDINLILTTSIEKPQPDPMLGSSDHVTPSSSEPLPGIFDGNDRDPLTTFTMPSSESTSDPLGLDITISPSSDVLQKNREPIEPSDDESEEHAEDEPKAPYSLATLLLASYASAVTLALVWVLWTGRGLSKPAAESVPTPPAIDWGKITAKAPASAASLPSDRTVGLGKSLVLGDLEIRPLVIMHQTARLYRVVDPDGERRETPDCLALTLRLTNKSRDRRLAPLELADVRDPGEGGAFIEAADGEQIAMFKLAMESEWSIQDQTFSEIEPGRSEDVVLVSEPLNERRLASPLVWRIKLKTGAERSEEIGVQFGRQEVGESNP
jgi:hypothetical protein